MRPVTEDRFRSLVDEGMIRAERCSFSDGLKILLRLSDEILVAPDHMRVGENAPDTWNRQPLSAGLLPQHFYLGTTQERIGLSPRFFGILHTLSSIARVGLDAIGSSSYVSPGFGYSSPIPLVLELRPRVRLEGLTVDTPIAGLLLFELDDDVQTGRLDHGTRFPLLEPR